MKTFIVFCSFAVFSIANTYAAEANDAPLKTVPQRFTGVLTQQTPDLQKAENYDAFAERVLVAEAAHAPKGETKTAQTKSVGTPSKRSQ
jgi:hypothetical protein